MKQYKHVNACKYLHRETRDKMYKPTEHITAEFENEPFAHFISTHTDDVRKVVNETIEELNDEPSKN